MYPEPPMIPAFIASVYMTPHTHADLMRASGGPHGFGMPPCARASGYSLVTSSMIAFSGYRSPQNTTSAVGRIEDPEHIEGGDTADDVGGPDDAIDMDAVRARGKPFVNLLVKMLEVIGRDSGLSGLSFLIPKLFRKGLRSLRCRPSSPQQAFEMFATAVKQFCTLAQKTS